MSPHDRLVSDLTAQRLEQDANAVLSCSRPILTPAMEEMAGAVLALLGDREARVEIMAGSQRTEDA